MFLRYFKWLLAAAFVLSFYVWMQTQSIRMGYKVDNLRKEYDKWEHENEVWRLKINQFLSLERLDQTAKQRNLTRPQEKDIIYLPR
jgi:cell division protein FtsL